MYTCLYNLSNERTGERERERERESEGHCFPLFRSDIIIALCYTDGDRLNLYNAPVVLDSYIMGG